MNAPIKKLASVLTATAMLLSTCVIAMAQDNTPVIGNSSLEIGQSNALVEESPSIHEQIPSLPEGSTCDLEKRMLEEIDAFEKSFTHGVKTTSQVPLATPDEFPPLQKNITYDPDEFPVAILEQSLSLQEAITYDLEKHILQEFADFERQITSLLETTPPAFLATPEEIPPLQEETTFELVKLIKTNTSYAASNSSRLGSAGVPLKEGTHVKFIDRLDLSDAIDSQGENYALKLYDILVQGAKTDGISNHLIDPHHSGALHVHNPSHNTDYYYLTVATFSGRDAMAKAENCYLYTRAVFDAFDRDYPAVFWLTGETFMMSQRTLRTTGELIIEIQLLLCGDQIPNGDGTALKFDMRQSIYTDPSILQAAIKENEKNTQMILSSTTGKNRYEKLRELNRWLTMNNAYYSGDLNATGPNEKPALWESISALKGNSGLNGPVCEAYSRALKVLCDCDGIPCVLVDGHASNGYTSEPHMWNYVELENGSWYAIDATWNDPSVPGKTGPVSGYENENYFLLGSTSIPEGDNRPFIDSHPVSNKVSTGPASTAFINGPELNLTRYEPNTPVTPAEPTPTIYNISVTSDDNGTAHANLTSAEEGQLIILSATPNAGYIFNGWMVESGDVILGNPNGSTTTFIMPTSNVVISASFVLVPTPTSYNIKVLNNGNGTAQANPTSAEEGDLIILSATPRSGYRFGGWIVESGNVVLGNPNSPYTSFRMPANDVTISASFVSIPTYKISATGDGNGTINISSTIAKEDELIFLEATPDKGYTFDKWIVTSGNITLSDPKQPCISFNMPTTDVAITASFRPIAFTHGVTVDISGEGTVYTNRTTANTGDLVILYATPHSGYRFNRWIVISGEVTLINPSSLYTSFRMPDADVKIIASFISSNPSMYPYFSRSRYDNSNH